jgi:hypothetical protein
MAIYPTTIKIDKKFMIKTISFRETAFMSPASDSDVWCCFLMPILLPILHRSLVGGGLTNIVLGFAGSPPNTIYGENIWYDGYYTCLFCLVIQYH